MGDVLISKWGAIGSGAVRESGREALRTPAGWTADDAWPERVKVGSSGDTSGGRPLSRAPSGALLVVMLSLFHPLFVFVKLT